MIEICVYGAQATCASCVGAPSPKETYEWIQAAVSRKYPDRSFQFVYVDIFNPPKDENKRQFAQKIIDEDLFYPVVVINGAIVAEGDPKLKQIYEAIERAR